MKKHFQQKPRVEMARLLKGNGVEIGVAGGEFSKMILDANKLTQLIGVDPYRGYAEYSDYMLQPTFDRLYNDMMNRVGHDPRFSLIKGMSGPTSDIFQDESLDFVYIDGNHSFKYVQMDMSAWYSKLKPGGILAGDDYSPRTSSRYDVIAAVDDWCEKYEISDLNIFEDPKTPGQWWFRK